MIIKDYSGNVLTNPEDWQKSTGRLLQSEEEEDTLVFTTWEEIPDLDSEGNVIDHSYADSVPTNAELAAAIEELAGIITE